MPGVVYPPAEPDDVVVVSVSSFSLIISEFRWLARTKLFSTLKAIIFASYLNVVKLYSEAGIWSYLKDKSRVFYIKKLHF